jgi:membrane protease YdiL (CAAX protease family)
MNLSVFSATSRPDPLTSSGLKRGVVGYLTAVVATELITHESPLLGAASLSVFFVSLVNLTILARVREATWPEHAWRLLAIATIPPLERLLMLCLPPLRWGQLQEYVFWSVPLLIGAVVLLATPLLATVPDFRPNLIRTRHGGYGLAGVSGQVLLALAGAALGALAGVLAEGKLGPIGQLVEAAQPAWVGIAVIVFAGCTQEFVYRAVIGPLATAVGNWVGILLSSLLMALAWVGWLGVGVRVALPIIASSLLFGWGVHRWRALTGVIAGHGLFNLALALLWHRVLL